MKYLVSQINYFFKNKTTQRNSLLLLRFLLIISVIVTVYSVLFHVLMLLEGKEYSWVTGFYWTLTVMSTLGFGDITFKTDIGLVFSIIVLLTGIVFLLIILPFTFIQFFYAPWLEAESKTRTPRELNENTANHIVLTRLDPITKNLIRKLTLYNYQYDYVILVEDLQKALELHDMGYKTMIGDYGDVETYKRLRIDKAALVVATNDDAINTSIAFTIREISKAVPIVTNASEDHSLDILEFAGSSYVFQFTKMLGRSLARRTLGISMGANVIWKLEELLIAEAPAMRTALEGKSLKETKLREKTGLTVVGIWKRGKFENAEPQTIITSSSVLLLAGSEKQLKNFDRLFSIDSANYSHNTPVLIVGGGRVGKASAEALEEQDIPYNVVEKNSSLSKNRQNYINGNAADIDVLKKAGIMDARSVIITTHNDDINIYLTIYCRQLRQDVQIISRANSERTISKLHRGGADLVMSYASMASNSILNLLNSEEIIMIVEGLSIFRTSARNLPGKTLFENRIRESCGCSVVAINRNDGMVLNPDPYSAFEESDELIMLGTVEAEKKFIEQFMG